MQHFKAVPARYWVDKPKSWAIEANCKMSMFTPSKYWRIAKTIAELGSAPTREFELPDALTNQTVPPKAGDGLLLADYDPNTTTGRVKYIGIIRNVTSRTAAVDWLETNSEIWVDTAAGRGYWSAKPGFRFAANKVAGYGLHQLFADVFPDLTPRENLPNGAQSVSTDHCGTARTSSIPRERLEPVEVIGEPSDSTRGGWVYLLKSAYGFKVGRTRNIPNRMRSFGVKLPIIYTIPMCVWFEDHIEAEAAYHRLFADKHINGEWFKLEEQDIEKIRNQEYLT
jgi:hypothetical protein